MTKLLDFHTFDLYLFITHLGITDERSNVDQEIVSDSVKNKFSGWLFSMSTLLDLALLLPCSGKYIEFIVCPVAIPKTIEEIRYMFPVVTTSTEM